MKVVLVNPNANELRAIEEIIRNAHADYEIACFKDSMLAYQYAFSNQPIDCLYTTIEMKRLDGFALARMMRADNSKLSIFFLSHDVRFKGDAERFGCECFLQLPLTSQILQKAEDEIDWELTV